MNITYFFIYAIYFGVPFFCVIGFIRSMTALKKTDKSDFWAWEDGKKKAILWWILSLIFVGGMIIFPIMLLYGIANHM